MSKYDKLKKEKQLIDEGMDEELDRLNNAADNLERMSDVAGHADIIIKDIDREFESATKLRGYDISFLFAAIGLLTAKWLIMSTVVPLSLSYPKPMPPERTDGRLTDKEGEKYAEGKLNDFRGEKGEAEKLAKVRQKRLKLTDVSKSAGSKMYEETGFRTIPQILFRPVPYDAIRREGFLKIDLPSFDGNTFLDLNESHYANTLGHIPVPTHGTLTSSDYQLPFSLSGKNHHAYTLGHDPTLGHLFGTVNILTRSITFRDADLSTFPVHEKGNVIYAPKYPQGFIQGIIDSISSMQEDEKRLPAALIKQELHIASDKYCKTGLPAFPFSSAAKAQEQIENHWNSVEAHKWLNKLGAELGKDLTIVAIQFAISLLINEIIKALHLLMYDELRDGAYSLYEVRTRRILLNANCIASSSNVLYSAFNACIKKDVLSGAKLLDIGGIIETTHRLISDTKFINQIKQEYLINRWNEIVSGTTENTIYGGMTL